MSDLEKIRKQLHLRNELIAVNAGSWGPLCEAARRAISKGYLEEAASRGDDPELMKTMGGLGRYDSVVKDAKKVLGRFLSCQPEEVALCDSSTTAMNIFMWGIDWKPGDEILTGSLENPAASIPMKILCERHGVKLNVIDQHYGEHDLTKHFCEAVNPKTRMLLISDVNFATGGRVDLSTISRAAHDTGALLLADGIQAVGTSQVDVHSLGVDGYAMSRHKFLCGPDGGGALYVRKEAMEHVKPTYSGVFSSADHGASEKIALSPTAQRYEVSTRPLPVIEGGTAAVNWIMDDVGLLFILRHTLELYQDLWDRVSGISGVQVLSGRNQRSLLSFTVNGIEPKTVVEKLRDELIFTRVIEATLPHCVRISVGFWNRDSDIERIEVTLRRIASHS